MENSARISNCIASSLAPVIFTTDLVRQKTLNSANICDYSNRNCWKKEQWVFYDENDAHVYLRFSHYVVHVVFTHSILLSRNIFHSQVHPHQLAFLTQLVLEASWLGRSNGVCAFKYRLLKSNDDFICTLSFLSCILIEAYVLNCATAHSSSTVFLFSNDFSMISYQHSEDGIFIESKLAVLQYHYGGWISVASIPKLGQRVCELNCGYLN